MLKNILFVLSALAVIARAQIPSLGWCPEYVPMANFDMEKFLGVWYEAERSFQISDLVSRCVMTNYTRGHDGKYRVSNEVTNRFTGVKRVLDGEIKPPTKKTEEGKLHVKYSTVPLTPETQYAVLETDYKNYAVLWSCSGIGPVNTQNSWLMTRARRPEGTILQKAYGVLDKYKISRSFFVKTNQDDCVWYDDQPAAPKPSENPSTAAPVVEEAPPVVEEAPEVVEPEQPVEPANMRSAIPPEVETVVDEKIAEEIPAKTQKSVEASPESVEETKVEKASEPVETPPVSVPEVILKAADRAKEALQETIDEVKKFEPIETIKETFEKPIEQIQKTLDKPVEKIQEAFEKPIENIKETLQKPYEQIKETLQKPLDKIKDVLAVETPENKEKSIENKAEESKDTIDKKQMET